MKNTCRSLLVCLVAACTVSATFAYSRVAGQSAPRRAPGLVRLHSGTRTAELGIGNPAKFSWMNAWMTSDQLPNENLTDSIFFVGEILTLETNFYSLTTDDVTASLQVRSTTGVLVFSNTFTTALDDPETPGPDPDTFWQLGLPQGDATLSLDPGSYKVFVKIKQGAKIVGSQFWVFVLP